MPASYADISLINTTFGTTHTFDADTDGAGIVETLRVKPSYGGRLTALKDGGSVRTGGDPSQTSVSISGSISSKGAVKASDTITKIQQVLHNGAFKIRFGNDDLELTDCVVRGFTYAPVIGGGEGVMTFDLDVVSGARYFTTTTLSSATTSISGVTTSGIVTFTGFDSDAPTRPIITITRDGASTVETSFQFTLNNANQTKDPQFALIKAKLGVDDVLVVDPFLESVYIETNNSGNALVPKRMDGVVPHAHTLLGAAVPTLSFLNTTSHSDFTIKAEWYTYRLCYTLQ